MIALGHLSALAVLLRELEGGLEEVHEQTRGAVQARDSLRSGDTLKAAVAQELAYDSAVLLLDPSLIVLAIGARASEFDPMTEAVIDQRLVHKLAAVINVQRTKREGQSQANAVESLDDQATLPHHQGRGLGPTTGDVGHNQAIDVAAAVDFPAMRDQVHLHAARRGFVPVREGAHRHTPACLRHRAANLPQACRATWHSQQSIDGRGAHGQNLLANRLTEMQMPIALQGRQQNRQQRPQTLPANPIGGFPQDDQRSPRRFVVQGGSDAGLRDFGDRLGVQRSNRRLLVIARYSNELIEDLALRGAGSRE